MNEISGFWAGAQDLARRVPIAALARRVGGYEALADCSAAELEALGVSPEDAARWRAQEPRRTRGLPLTLADPGYPSLLAELDDPPPVLILEGDPACLEQRCLAVVGTRSCTPYGIAVARHLGGAAAAAGWTVVSGLARGIDAHAHWAALAAGRTLAVLGHGLDFTSPASNRRLRRKILDAGGLLLTTFPDDHRAAPHTFPIRNRWIAGLSERLVVVEAPPRSGAIITFEHMKDINDRREERREDRRGVWVVPGSIGSHASRGSNALLMEKGVTPLLDVETFVSGGEAPVDREEWLRSLFGGASVDEAARLKGVSTLELLRELAILEVEGRVVRLPGRRYAPAGGASPCGTYPS